MNWKRVAIIGSRNYPRLDIMKQVIFAEQEQYFVTSGARDRIVIVSGGAEGVDTVAEEVAEELGVPCVVIFPEYSNSKNNKYAPIARNRQIIRAVDCVVALWDGKSRGTAHALKFAFEAKREVVVYDANGRIMATDEIQQRLREVLA